MDSRTSRITLSLLVLLLLLLVTLMAACATRKNAQQTPAPPAPTTPAPQQPAAAAFEVRRGCPACHVKTATKDYSLAAEAKERAKAGGGTHPDKTPTGVTLDEKAKLSDCLTCHGVGTNGKAKGAPLTLRTILHPAHMFSEGFVTKYRGNCFTCHEVNPKGEFYGLGDKVETNEKGIPKTVPIPGMLAPS